MTRKRYQPRCQWIIFEGHRHIWKLWPSTHWIFRTIQRSMAWRQTIQTTLPNPHAPNQNQGCFVGYWDNVYRSLFDDLECWKLSSMRKKLTLRDKKFWALWKKNLRCVSSSFASTHFLFRTEYVKYHLYPARASDPDSNFCCVRVIEWSPKWAPK